MHFDPLSFHEHSKPEPAYRPVKVMLKLLAMLVVGSVLVAVPIAASAYRMVREAQAGRSALMAAAASAQAGNFSLAANDLAFAEQHLASSERFAVALAPLEVLPYAGTKVRAARGLVRASHLTATSLNRVAGLGSSVLGVLEKAGTLDKNAPTVAGGVDAFFRLPSEDRRAVLDELVRVPRDFSASVEEIDEALVGFNNLPSDPLVDPIVASLQPMIGKLGELRDRLSAAAEMAKLLPALSGYPEPKKYLLIFQNNAEMRPTGGFIGTLGEVTISAAQARDLTVRDVYAIDGAAGEKLKTVPPPPLAKYLAVNKWYLRDANWSPDFPTSARKIVDILGQEVGAEALSFDGVLAIDPTVAADLLRIVGNVSLGGSTFTPDNVADEVEYQVEKGFDAKGLPVAQRKDILIALSGEVFKRCLELPSARWPEVIDALSRGLYEKHILIASFDPAVAAYARERRWDGAMREASGDYLMVVDANLAALKTDSVVTRSINYSLAQSGSGYIATVRLAYANHGGFSWKTTRYRTYTRVYVPAGSELLSSSGAMENDKIIDPKRTPGKPDVGDDLGRRYFGAFLSVEPGETREITFTYRLPASVAVNGAHYSLLVQKQPGTEAVPLTLNLDFGKKVASATPPEDRKYWGNTRYEASTDLRTDREFAVGF